jgi:hypothetical protein
VATNLRLSNIVVAQTPNGSKKLTTLWKTANCAENDNQTDEPYSSCVINGIVYPVTIKRAPSSNGNTWGDMYDISRPHPLPDLFGI